MTRPFPPAFEAFVAPARARPQLWRLIAGVALSLGVYVASIAALVLGAMFLAGPGLIAAVEGLPAPRAPGETLLLLASFLGMALGPILAARLLHRRSAATLLGPPARVARDFAVAAAAAGAVFALAMAAWRVLFSPEPGLSIGLWLALLPLALLGVAIQTGAEEILFRGYLQQQLAARFRSPFAWLVLPSLAFGAVHYDPSSAGGNAVLVVVSAGAFGFVAADLTARTGSLGAAWGFHFANNVFALLLVTTQGTIEGLALYTTPYAVDETGPLRFLMLADLAVLALVWVVLRRVLRV